MILKSHLYIDGTFVYKRVIRVLSMHNHSYFDKNVINTLIKNIVQSNFTFIL